MRDRALALARGGMYDDQIAAVLTGEGHRSPNSEREVFPITIQRIRHAAGMQVSQPRTRWTHDADVLTAPNSGKLNIPVESLYVQIEEKEALGRAPAERSLLFNDTAAVLHGVQRLRGHEIDHLDLNLSA